MAEGSEGAAGQAFGGVAGRDADPGARRAGDGVDDQGADQDGGGADGGAADAVPGMLAVMQWH